MIDYAKKFEADTGSYPFTTRKAVALPGHATIEYVDWLGRQLTALKDKIAEGIPVDIAYTGSTNIITNLPNALFGKFILIGLNEMEDDDD